MVVDGPEKASLLKPGELLFYLAYALRALTVGSANKEGNSMHARFTEAMGVEERLDVSTDGDVTLVKLDGSEERVYIVFDFDGWKIAGIRIPKE